MSPAPTRVVRNLCLIAVCLGTAACGSGTTRPPGADGTSPGMAAVDISPRPAYASNVLTALVTPTTAAASAAHYTYQWRKNGDPIEGATGATLPNGAFRKGDLITVTVTAGGGLQSDAPLTSHPVAILNSPPSVTAVGIEPAPLYQAMAVHAAAQGSDADGDALVYSYQWYKNGAIIPDQTSDTLDGALVAKGDHLQVRVTPFDGAAAGDPRLSPLVTVQNSPPRITSQPPSSLNDDDTYVYQVVAVDPDGGPVTYSLKSAPERMSIDPAQGIIRWKATKQDAGIHPIEIVATDAEGATIIQRYDLQIYDLKDKTAAQPAAPPPHS